MRKLAIIAALMLLATPAFAQNRMDTSLTLPTSGNNQRASVMQYIGPVKITIDYSSPDVHGPNGEDRRGKIYGTDVVHWGWKNLGFGTCTQCPWRAGSNENTVFTTSHDILVEGQRLPAGSYGLFMVADPATWTVIFSKNSTSWGSYTYDASEDALRVQAKPQPSEHHEWLTYEFTDRRPDKATVALQWERLALPIELAVEDATGLWVENLRRELRSNPGFDWRGWQAAADFTLASNAHLEQGLEWAKAAVEGPLGQPNFRTLSTLSRLQEATGHSADAAKSMEAALEHPTAGPFDVHGFARQLQAAGKNEEAMRVFQLNARKFPGVWPTAFGLARGHAGLGQNEQALEQARAAMAQAPDNQAKANVEAFIKQLEAGAG